MFTAQAAMALSSFQRSLTASTASEEQFNQLGRFEAIYPFIKPHHPHSDYLHCADL